MKVSLVNLSDISGGAARAAYRIHKAIGQYGIESSMLVNRAIAGDPEILGVTGNWKKLFNIVRPRSAALLRQFLKTDNPIVHSPAIMPTGWPARLGRSDADLLHLHWVNGEMMSIRGIGKINKPIVWTLHDMWAFCGAEHYTEDFRWRDGYDQDNRPDSEAGFDLNRWTWRRKLKHWKDPLHIVTPSQWLADCVQQSALMSDWPVTVIPNALDVDSWQPVEKQQARELLQLPQDAPLVLFGALGGTADPRKGFDLLRSALDHLRGEIKGLKIVIFGQRAPVVAEDFGFPVSYLGHLHDDISLRLAYSAADVMLVPSRQEAFGQTALEALTCGTPVIAFAATGLLDVVKHKETGYLAKPFDSADFAAGIQWVLADNDNHEELCSAARRDAIERFSYNTVAEKYALVYENALANK